MYALMYNLVRVVMLEAAHRQKVPIERISFVDAVRWLAEAVSSSAPLQLRINPHRPGRVKPGVKKRRAKPYDLMNQPREVLRKRLLDKANAASHFPFSPQAAPGQRPQTRSPRRILAAWLSIVVIERGLPGAVRVGRQTAEPPEGDPVVPCFRPTGDSGSLAPRPADQPRCQAQAVRRSGHRPSSCSRRSRRTCSTSRSSSTTA
jgi:hypothetical protein